MGKNRFGVSANLFATSPVRPNVRSLPTITRSFFRVCIQMTCGIVRNNLIETSAAPVPMRSMLHPGNVDVFHRKKRGTSSPGLRRIHRRGGAADIEKASQPALQ